MVGTRSLSSGAHSRDPLALLTLPQMSGGSSRDGLDDAALGTQRCAIGRGGLFRGDVDHHVGDLVDAGKTLQQRGRTELLNEARGRLLDRLAALLRQILDEGFHAL